jgi:hypothetical protein
MDLDPKRPNDLHFGSKAHEITSSLNGNPKATASARTSQVPPPRAVAFGLPFDDVQPNREVVS